MNKIIFAFGLFLFAIGLIGLNYAEAAQVDSIYVPPHVQEHVDYVTKNCEVRTHLTIRNEEDMFGAIYKDPLRNFDRIVRSCAGAEFGNSKSVWNRFHESFVRSFNSETPVAVYGRSFETMKNFLYDSKTFFGGTK